MIQVPLLIGMHISDALAELSKLGFKGVTNAPVDFWDSSVTDQSPNGGLAAKGSTVRVNHNR
jgi:beta-lactam-binding protein with PASTA domain